MNVKNMKAPRHEDMGNWHLLRLLCSWIWRRDTLVKFPAFCGNITFFSSFSKTAEPIQHITERNTQEEVLMFMRTIVRTSISDGLNLI